MPNDPPSGNEHDITPDPSLLEDIGMASFRTDEAIAELVANSMDAKIVRDEKSLEEGPIRVEVKLMANEIQILDDGKGMDEQELADALRLAFKKNPLEGASPGKKSEWGLGLKTASASLGRYWSVTTRPVKGDSEYFVEVDLESWKSRAGERNPKWRIRIVPSKRTTTGPLGTCSHGTAITIKMLREPNPAPGPIIQHLSRAYKPHLMIGDRIFVGDVECVPPELRLIENSRVELNVQCGANVITGWVGLDTLTHNDDAYGINIYRNRQLVDAWNKDWFRAHLMTSRIMGEVNLDFVKGNFHKKGFAKSTPEWQQASWVMREALKPVVRAATAASRGRNDRTRWARATQALQNAMGKTGDRSLVSVLAGDAPPPDIPYVMNDEGDFEVEPGVLHMPGEDVRLTSVLTDLHDEQLAWSPIYGEDGTEVKAVVNTGSKVFISTKDPELLSRIALADCLAQFLIKRRHFDPARAWAVRDRWLFVATE